MIIAFCGLDGSGKTSQARKLTYYLNKKGRRSICIHWMSCYPRYTHRVSSSLRSENYLSKKRNFLSSFIILAGRLFIVFFNAFCISIKVSLAFLQRENVVLDRYILDDLVHLRYKGLNEKLFLFFLKFVPVGKKIFYLQISPEEAQKRERGDNHQFTYFLEKSAIYDKVAQLKKVKKIKAGEGVNEEETFREILKVL